MTSDGRERQQRGSPRSDLVSLTVSVAIHLLILFLVPASVQPVYDVYPLDYSGVIEIATTQGQPASPAPAPGVEISQDEPKPAVVPEKQPEPAKTPPAVVATVEPAAKPVEKPAEKPVDRVQTEPKVQPAPVETPATTSTPAPEPATAKPTVEEQTLVTSPAGDTPIKTAAAPEEVATVPVEVPQPTLRYATSGAASATGTTTAAQGQPQLPQAGPGRPDGTGTVPRPDFPGTDPTGWSMVRTTGGTDHGVWIPKGVQNIRSRGESTVRVEVGADGKLKSAVMVKAPPDAAMGGAILDAVKSSWEFLPDRTEGRKESYFIEFKIGYDGGSGDVWVDSLRAFY